jgi:hypothetical protein
MRIRGLTLPLSINFALRPVPTRLKYGLSTPIARDGAGEIMAGISRLPCGICTNPMIFAFSISTLSGLSPLSTQRARHTRDVRARRGFLILGYCC